MRLQAPTLENCQTVRIWRNECLETLRTPYALTAGMQEAFYRDVICNRNSPHRYWSIEEKWKERQATAQRDRMPQGIYLVGFGGLTFIETINRQAEISLIINPELRGKGYGEKAVELLLDHAFNYLNLGLVYGECYCCNDSGVDFWEKITESYKGQFHFIRKGKYWNGKKYGSLYFEITKDEFNGRNKAT